MSLTSYRAAPPREPEEPKICPTSVSHASRNYNHREFAIISCVKLPGLRMINRTVIAKKTGNIRRCRPDELEEICGIINDAALVYKGVIPDDRWREPYMPMAELKAEVAAGVSFWGLEERNKLAGVMGVQSIQDVVLIRHAYVRTAFRNRGIGSDLLRRLHSLAPGPVLVGTWAAATWAIAFYEKHGFRKVIPAEKERLLKKYWTVPDRQIETSVVLADHKWFQTAQSEMR